MATQRMEDTEAENLILNVKVICAYYINTLNVFFPTDSASNLKIIDFLSSIIICFI